MRRNGAGRLPHTLPDYRQCAPHYICIVLFLFVLDGTAHPLKVGMGRLMRPARCAHSVVATAVRSFKGFATKRLYLYKYCSLSLSECMCVCVCEWLLIPINLLHSNFCFLPKHISGMQRAKQVSAHSRMHSVATSTNSQGSCDAGVITRPVTFAST